MTRWFAWYPVQLWNGHRVWLRWVFRADAVLGDEDARDGPYDPLGRLATTPIYYTTSEIEQTPRVTTFRHNSL